MIGLWQVAQVEVTCQKLVDSVVMVVHGDGVKCHCMLLFSIGIWG